MRKKVQRAGKDSGRKAQSAKSTVLRVGRESTLREPLQELLFWSSIAVLVVVPLLFNVSAYHIFVFPKFCALLFGASLVLLSLLVLCHRLGLARVVEPLRSKNTAPVVLLLVPTVVSTLFGVDPLATFWGSPTIHMGLLSRICFLIVFLGLIVGIGGSVDRFRLALWTVAATGLIIALYAFVQFVGRDPFLPARLYTSNAPSGPVMRVVSTLGHSNYLGNILMYTIPLTLGLALGSRGRPRRIGIVACALSTAAVAFSGTRGAWLGLVAGVAVFVLLASGEWKVSRTWWTRGKVIKVTVLVLSVGLAVVVIVLSPASRNIGARARSFVSDRFTGSGRTLLWRDSLKMAVDFPIIGCGPEGFSKAFPAYKSVDVVRLSPGSSDESSHNSFLDAAISFGFAGAILYAAIIATAARQLIGTSRAIAQTGMKWFGFGMTAALAAVSFHNLFIYDQIPTGLYFFGLMALAVSFLNVTRVDVVEPARQTKSVPIRFERTLWKIAAAGALVLPILAGWYWIAGTQAEAAIKSSLAAARTGDFDTMVGTGMRAVTHGLDPTKPYHSMFARALATYVEVTSGESSKEADESDTRQTRLRAARMGIEYGEIGAIHSLTPVADYCLLAELAMASNDTERGRKFAEQAVRLDSGYYRAHLLLAEAELADGDRNAAEQESRIALTLNPGASEVAAFRARIRADSSDESIRLLVQRARSAAEHGNFAKAIKLLRRARDLSRTACPDCLEALAETYEKAGRLEEALSEWRELSATAGDDATRRRALSKAVEVSEKIKGTARR